VAAKSINVAAVTAAGFAALRRGDPSEARALFNQAIAAGCADSAVWYGLSRVHRSMGNTQEEHASLDRVLSLDPRHLPALLAKGDLFAKIGDWRAADSHYTAGLKLGASIPSLSAEWRAELQRVEQLSKGFAREYEAHLLGALSAVGLGEPGTERFAHAVDLLLGKRQIYFQQPKYFFFPELPQIQFFDRRVFPWVGALEGAFAAIRDEARTILDEDAGFVPYVQRDADQPAFDVRGLLDNPDWSAFFLIKDGAVVAKNAARCPRTMASLAEVPLSRIDNRTPSVLFSLLRPGARIPPHHGFMNARVIGHLPLIVPPKCALRVGNETRAWREGEVVLFDDSIEHEAWNSSSEPRLVLIFDVWRPELSERERGLIATMLGGVDGLKVSKSQWTE
jgi:aspartate beta-hydroxylase